MTKSLWCFSMAFAAAAATAQEQARVLSAVPVIEPVRVAHQVCGAERTVVQPVTNTRAGATVGMVAGGVAGNAVGGGEGRALMTLLGAALGALWGDRAESSRTPLQARVRDCTWVSVQEDGVVGYDVRYEYAGRQYQVRLAQDPGATVSVQVVRAGPSPAAAPGKAVRPAGGEDFSGG